MPEVAAGRPAEERVDELLAAGATHLIYRIGMEAPWDLSAVEQLLAWRDKQNGA